MKESSRRAFLAACGLSVTAGCAAPNTPGEGTATRTRTATDDDTDTATGTAASEQPDIDLGPDPVWPMFGGTAANTGRRGDGSGPRETVQQAWRTDVGGIYTMPGPVLVEDTVYVGSGKQAYAMDAFTGERRWSAAMGSLTHYFSPAAAAESVLFGAQSNIASGGEGRLTSFTTGGTEQWRRDLAITSSPVAVDGTVYLGASPDSGAQLRALATGDGNDRWAISLDALKLRGAPAVVDDVVYATATTAGEEAGVIAARDAADGSEVWTKVVDTAVTAAPAVQDGSVYAQADDGRLLVLDAATGEIEWTARLGENGATAPALSDETAVGLVENTLVGIDLATGDRRWEADIGYALINGVSIAGDRAYVGGSKLTAVDIESGDTAWSQPIPGEGGAYGAPVVVGNTAFVGVCIKEEANDPYDDYLYAYI